MLRRPALGYLFAAMLSIAICAGFYELWRLDPNVSIYLPQEDFGFFLAVIFKGTIDNDWYSFNPYIGAPTGLDAHDFPIPDLLFLLWIKAAALFTKNPFRIANWTIVLGFPLVTVPTLFVLRRLGLRYSIALVASLLFTFLSFHHARVSGHLTLAGGYFTVPLAMLVALEIFRGKPILLEKGTSWWRPRWVVGSRPSRFALGVALLVGFTGTMYFPFFSAFGVLVAGAVGTWRRRELEPVVRGALVAFVVTVAFAINVAPNLRYFHEHGRVAAAGRSPGESEVYGLKLTELLFPISGHRLVPFRKFKHRYDLEAPLINENKSAYLGIIGGLGFLYLVGTVLRGERGRGGGAREEEPESAAAGAVDDPEVMQGLRILNLAMFVLGTIGGLGAMIAFLIFPSIRGYNRVSVYCAFFSLTAIAFLLERAVRRFSRHGLAIRLLPIGLTVALVLGLFDQTPVLGFDYELSKQHFLNDEKLAHDIEASLPPGSSVFQLPYIPFPENGRVQKLEDYELFRPYLHATSTRWSYGAMRGRRGDQWNKDMAAQPVPEMIESLVLAGFAGVHVSRDAYADHGAAIEAALSGVLGAPTVVSPHGDASFFPLKARRESLLAQLGQGAFDLRASEVKDRIFLGWLDGYYPFENGPEGTWTWGGATSHFVIENPSNATRKVTFDVLVRAVDPAMSVRIEGDLFREELHPGRDGFHLVKTLDVPSGQHLFRVVGSGKPENAAPNDSRDIHVAMYNPRVTPVATSTSEGQQRK
ncbi:hypothetical protein [Pendulispora albinea]|uniref:DUF6311 domain-containing protein n=1 Tax=Pendulispora albinea TaxID=2741071 RepID=A0ABZ2LKH7_9BACT